jgi:hypothetical protein
MHGGIFSIGKYRDRFSEKPGASGIIAYLYYPGFLETGTYILSWNLPAVTQ